MQRYLILVLSVPRGGGSALAGALAKAGAHPGTHLIPPTPDAPYGNWECAPLVRLNDRLLLELGARWDSMAPLPTGWPTLPAVQALRPEATDAIAGELGGAKLAVLKDPRLCRLLPFWRDLLTEAGYAVSCALMLRRPMEVAASLSRRNQFSPEKSLALWLAHITEAERNSRGLPRAALSYDALLANTTDALTRVCDDAAFPMKSTAAQRKAAIEQVRPELRKHEHGGSRKPLREAMASGLDTALDTGYTKLAHLPAGRDPRNAVEALATLAQPALAAAVPPWVAEELAATQAVGQQLALEVDAARRRIDELATHVDTARTAHAARDSDKAALRARADEIASARKELAEARKALSAAEAARDDIETALREARAASEGDEGALRARTDELAAARRELAKIDEARRAAISEIGTLRDAERDHREQTGRMQRELGDERSAIAQLTGQIDQARASAQAQERQIESANGQIQNLLSQLATTRQTYASNDAQVAVQRRELDVARDEIAEIDAERKKLRAECDDAGAKLAMQSIETETLRHDLAALERKHGPLAETARETQQKAASLAAELERRVAAERELSEDRTRLAQLEREARERIAMIERRLTELTAEAKGLTERLAVTSAELARLDAHWLGRMARRLARKK